MVGKVASEFSLDDQHGKKVSLYETLKSGPVLLAFYPGDFTPVCTRQLCNYSDNLSSFSKFDLQVLGISHNSVESHASFATKYNFPFPLLSDPDRKIAEQYGCRSFFMFGRTTRAVFIVSPKRVILYRYVEPTILTHRNSGEITKILLDMKVNGIL